MGFDVIYRPQGLRQQAGMPSRPETVLVSFRNRFQRDGAHPSDVVPYMASAEGIAAAAQAGDTLLLRMTVTGGDAGAVWVPNADGVVRHGQIPHLVLPQ